MNSCTRQPSPVHACLTCQAHGDRRHWAHAELGKCGCVCPYPFRSLFETSRCSRWVELPSDSARARNFCTVNKCIKPQPLQTSALVHIVDAMSATDSKSRFARTACTPFLQPQLRIQGAADSLYWKPLAQELPPRSVVGSTLVQHTLQPWSAAAAAYSIPVIQGCRSTTSPEIYLYVYSWTRRCNAWHDRRTQGLCEALLPHPLCLNLQKWPLQVHSFQQNSDHPLAP